jgi:hydroxymethylpyrimidine pyrophosphatase-like HAD family hydrolase
MADIDLVVTDLDGTLWVGAEVTHPGTLDAWLALEERGIPVLVATGRRVTSTREPLARLGLAPTAVVLNGALVIDLATDERFHRQHYPTGEAVRVLAAFRELGIEPCVYVDHVRIDVHIGDQPSTHPEHLRALGSTAASADLDVTVADVPVLMFGLMGHDEGALEDVQRALNGVAEVHIATDQYGGHSCTVTPLGLSKWVGVMVYCERHGIDASRVLAIGDGPNDRELLAGAAIAVVPEDAHADALAAADHVVASTREGGWAEILDLV